MFLDFNFWLNCHGLSKLAAVNRFLVYWLLWFFLREREYNPWLQVENGTKTVVYTHWVEAPLVGTLAYREFDRPSKLIFEW